MGAALLALATLTLSACTSNPRDEHEPDSTTQVVQDARNERQWNELVRSEWDLDRPLVEPVMGVDSNRRTIVLSKCMVDSGFDSLTQVGDSLALAVSESNAKASALAYYTCAVKYPALEPVVGYLSTPRRSALYAHLVERVAPCLRLLGYTVDAPPDRETFVAHYYRDEGWNPYSLIWLPANSVGWQIIDAKCAPPSGQLGQFHP